MNGSMGVQAVSWKLLNLCLKVQAQTSSKMLDTICRSTGHHNILDPEHCFSDSLFHNSSLTAALQKMETIRFACPVGLANGKEKILTFQAAGGCQNPKDKIKYEARPQS
jgi:hypothetical protein